MNLDRFKLDGKVALVTGGAQGLGQALAVGLAEAGADVILLDLQPAAATAEQISALGRVSHTLQYDLEHTDPEQARTIIDQSVAALGRLDILINNAGIIRRARALDFNQADWEAVLRIDLSATFYLAQAAARHFVQQLQPGKIINVASMLSFQGGILVPSYTAAKSGVAGLTRALANEWAKLDINVNALAPGYMATEVTTAIRADPARSETMLGRIPAGRWGEPDDLKGAAIFLASDAARYVHGAIIPVDGGWLAS